VTQNDKRFTEIQVMQLVNCSFYCIYSCLGIILRCLSAYCSRSAVLSLPEFSQ